MEKASSKEEKEALTREYHFWEWNYPTVLAKENSRKLRESYLKKKLQEIEDEGDVYESIEEIWPDYPTKEDFLFNEDEY